MHIADSGQMSISDLSMACEIDEEEINQRMSYWITKGVVRKDSRIDTVGVSIICYTVIEEQAANALRDLTETVDIDGELVDGLTVSSEVQEKEALATIEG